MSSLGGISINSLPLLEDASVKAGCLTFDILQDGEIQALKHGPGYVIPFMKGCRRFRVQFMSCTNV
jgi:hypothetical protein